MLLLLFILVPRQVCLTGCWSVFDACCLGELAAALVGVLDWVLGGMVGVAVVVVNGMVVGGRKLIDVATVATNKKNSGNKQTAPVLSMQKVLSAVAI